MMNFKINELTILLFTLFLHAIASISTNYFQEETINPGTIRGLIVGLFVIYFLIRRFKFTSINFAVLLYLLYLGLLTIFSSDFFRSSYLYISVFISTMMLPMGFYYIDTKEKLFMIAKVFLAILTLFLLNFVIANIFQLGSSDYLEDSFYFGAGRVNITKAMLILLFTAPVFIYSVKNIFYRNFGIIIYTATLIICLIGIKRSVLLSMIFGVLVFWYFSPSLTKTARYYIVTILILVGSFPIYGDLLKERLEAREASFELTEERFEIEGRYHEINRVINSMKEGDLKHRLIGSEIFNDIYFYNTRRMLHTDYMVILNGAGIIGLIGWFLIFIVIIRQKYFYFKLLKNDSYMHLLNGVFWALIVSQLIISISGTIYEIAFRSFIMVLFGGILGNMRSETLKLKHSPYAS